MNLKSYFNKGTRELFLLFFSFMIMQFINIQDSHAAVVDAHYRITSVKKVSLRTKAINYKSKTAMWTYPYRSNKLAKKTHWLKNYAKRSLMVTKSATLKNGLKYDFVQVANKPSVYGWVYAKNLQQMTMVSLGDSITKGWTGSSYATSPYPQLVSQQLYVLDTNLGQNNGKVVGDTNLDLTSNVTTTNFKKVDIATIAYGVNDYFHSSLTDVTQVLDDQIKGIKHQNPTIQLFGILPLNCYVTAFGTDQQSDAYSTVGYHDYTLSQLCDAEAEVYEDNGVKYLDWRSVDPDIVPTTIDTSIFGDGKLHPTQATYNQVGTDIANFLEKNLK
ncbi:MAG: SGNH/GDSL hydrolase family protein [Lentilactobacillus hilgardii]|uniref:SGNH/GDSL hydrolase family protein n=3 Tax=Lentilactobacillus hilgardii TaxID=1588 RepID=UPI001CC215BE|nr:SGNH/GDSL hydrolase family protein [Lentilactobacillus hilgardii]MBZ2201794.1 GDSL family lipase [Lentilactobacillus hilgardii]MBZ2204711.1 GDSL family lipase [Lentilactobacillus hilgardii]